MALPLHEIDGWLAKFRHEFVREKVEPLDLAFPGSVAPFDRKNQMYKEATAPLALRRNPGLAALARQLRAAEENGMIA